MTACKYHLILNVKIFKIWQPRSSRISFLIKIKVIKLFLLKKNKEKKNFVLKQVATL